MKKVMKIVALMAVMTMLVASFAGCGKTSDTFKIGGIGPITGPASSYGISVKQGAQLAVDEINAAGGINGYPIEFKFEDDEHDAEKSTNAYNTLKDWGMQMLLGTVTTNPCLAVIELSSQDNMFQITPSASNVACVKYDNTFRVCFSDPNQGPASANYIMSNITDKVAVIYNSSDSYSSGIYETFAAEAANIGLEIVSTETFTDDSKSDFSVQLEKASVAGAELIFLPVYYEVAALVLSQASSLGYEFAFFGCDGLDGILNLEGFDTSLAEGTILLTPFAADATDDLTVTFVSSYTEAYGSTPDQFAADGYDGIYAIKLAIEQANATPDMSVSDLCDAMKVAMTEITLDGVTGVNMTWTADGEPNKAPKAVVIKDGKYVSYE